MRLLALNLIPTVSLFCKAWGSTILKSVLYVAPFIGFAPAALGQGTVTFTPLSSESQAAAYQAQAVWTLLLDVQHSGIGYLATSAATNGYGTSLNAAYSASVLVSESGGTVSVIDQILNGRFDTTGAEAGTNISSSAPLSGVLIYMTDAFAPADGGATVTDLYIGSNYQPAVADTTSGATFGGGLVCMFSNATATPSDIQFLINQPAGSGGERIYLIGLADPVPEPSSLVLAGIGGLALLTIKRRN